MSRELPYLVDLSTRESTFVQGDHWGIGAGLFADKMRTDRQYIIIYTH